jgi:hypothetical protein
LISEFEGRNRERIADRAIGPDSFCCDFVLLQRRGAQPPPVQPVPAAQVANRFGSAPWDTAARVPEFRAAVLALEPTF